MAKKKTSDLKLTDTFELDVKAAFDDFVGGTAVEQVQQISLDLLFDNPDQTFDRYTEEDLKRFADKIDREGMHSPCIVTPDGNGYRIAIGSWVWEQVIYM